MTLGLSLSAFTTLHVVISLIGIASGFVVLYGMLGSQRLPGWTALFLATTILTSVTGFMFPINGVTPGLVVGAISLVLLGLALLGLYVFRLAGPWRWVYVFTALAALYFNVFVGVVQAFQKLAFLHVVAAFYTDRFDHADNRAADFGDPVGFDDAAQGLARSQRLERRGASPCAYQDHLLKFLLRLIHSVFQKSGYVPRAGPVPAARGVVRGTVEELNRFAVGSEAR